MNDGTWLSLDEFMQAVLAVCTDDLGRPLPDLSPTDLVTTPKLDLDSIDLLMFLGALADRVAPDIDLVDTTPTWDDITFAELHHLCGMATRS